MKFINSDNIILGISEKKDGPMKTSRSNRLSFFKNEGLDRKIIISAGLTHGQKVAIIDNLDKETTINDCDALITSSSQYLLTITVADCLPIYFYDDNKKIVALAHAGWRGVASKIASEVINSFINYYGSDQNDLRVLIGPHIRGCHFEVKKDVADHFKEDCLIKKNGKIYIDLSLSVKNQLTELGVPADNINIINECTYCLSDKYYSFRRDHPEIIETMVAYICLK